MQGHSQNQPVIDSKGNAALHVHDGHFRTELSWFRNRRVSQVTRCEFLILRGPGGAGPRLSPGLNNDGIRPGNSRHLAAQSPFACPGRPPQLHSYEVSFVESDPETQPERVKGNE